MRVLLVARTASALPEQAPWDPRSPWWPWAVLCGEPAERGYDVTPVPPAPAPREGGSAGSSRGGPRAALGRLRRGLRARAAGASAAWVQALGGDPAVRRAVRRADVVWSLDPDTDAALAAQPSLTQGRPVVPSRAAAARLQTVAALHTLLTEVAAAAPARRARPPAQPDVDRWRRQASELAVGDLPSELRSLDAVTEALRTRRHRHRQLAAARAVVALDSAPWPAEERGASGLAAQRAAADLSLGLLPWDWVDEEALARAATAAARGADAALDAGDPALALARLGDAMALLFHRARHAEVPRSALVEDPTAYLEPLRASRTYVTLLTAQDQARTDTGEEPLDATPEGDQVRVLVVTGGYGAFHDEVAEALEGHAEVQVRDFTRLHPRLGHRLMTPWALPAVACLVSQEQGSGRSSADRRLAAEVAAISAQLRLAVDRADVIFSDWADPTTVWLSHVCPPGVRLVVRVHALDALDPWLHLVNWGRVETVLVVSEPMRSLVLDLLDGFPGASPAVTTMHVITGLRQMGRPKPATARHTLGMIGWGRRVKDVLWALDLLERDPGWRLVLVGPGPSHRPTPVESPYVDQVRQRLASPSLRERVEVIGPVDDVSAPLQRVGVILSTSVREGWHLGLVEGAASGAVPVVRNWPLLASRGGPRHLYPSEWVVDDLDQAEARVRKVTDVRCWDAESALARRQALALFDPEAVKESYRQVLLRREGRGHTQDW